MATTEDHRLVRVSANPARGLISLLAIVVSTAGAGILWGVGAALIAGGLLIWIDCSLDELAERVTLIKRGWK